MQSRDTPFPTGWWGQELPHVRPRVSTYGRYEYDGLPPLPFELRGDLAWLAVQAQHDHNIAIEKLAENALALDAVLKVSASRGLILPNEFIRFFQSADLQRRVRSCTNCFLDLSPAFVPSPLDDGRLLRFLADSQGCLFWYLYQNSGGADHCIVATPDFYGAEAGQWQTEPPDPSQIIFCEASFEEFLCRFWLENEIWYCNYEKRPVFAEGARYLAQYGSPT